MSSPDRKPASNLQRIWKDWLEPLAFALVITQFLATLVGVSGNSMLPGLRNGERVLVPKYETWLYKAGLGEYKRGDILIFKPPHNTPPQLGLTRTSFGFQYRPFLIKRLIGLPGDKVSIHNGEITVNGVLLDQSWITDFWKQQNCWDTSSPLAQSAYASIGGFLQESKEVTVPQGTYFVVGDNRTVTGSEDSRMFGVIERKDVAGRAAAVVWPPFRKTNMTYHCSEQKVTELSGDTQFNLRLLYAPDQFIHLR